MATLGEKLTAVVTQGSDATLIDLSKNKLDDQCAVSEVTRLVKNYSSFAANAFIHTLLLSGPAGASRPCHWRRRGCFKRRLL